MKRWTTWALVGIVAAAIPAGGWLVWSGLATAGTDQPAPMPSSTWSVEVGTPVGPTSATIPPDSEGVSGSPPPATPSVLTPADMAPSTLFIPSLAAYAPVDNVAVTGGAMRIPDDARRVGRWENGAALDDPTGTVLIAGHVAWHGRQGAMRDLAHIEPNAVVYTTAADGALTRWQVTSIRTASRFDVHQALFTKTGPHQLVLVTCGGRVIDGHFEHNVIVTAAPTN